MSQAIEQGKTPVYSEMRSVKINLIESIPYSCISGIFIILASVIVAQIQINEMVKIAVVLLINNFFGTLAEYIFTILKNQLRIRLCKKLGIEPTEKNISLMESLEYQSV